MPYKQILMKPGVNTTLTATANPGGLSGSNLIRSNQGTVERLAGWERLFADPCAGFVRAMHAYQDLQRNNILILGTDGGSQIYIDGELLDMNLVAEDVELTPPFYSFTTSSATLTFTDTAHGLSPGDFVRIPMILGGASPIAPGDQPLLPVGIYEVQTVIDADTYTITNTTTSTVTGSTGGYPPRFVVNFSGALSRFEILVGLQNHGLVAGDAFNVGVSTSFPTNGITLFGPYTVDRVVDQFSFVIVQATEASTGTLELVQENGGNAILQYLAGAPGQPENWFLDNLGQDGLILTADGPLYVFTPPLESLPAATLVETAPQVNTGMFVAMPQAQVICFGSEEVIGGGVQDPLLVRWSDAGSYSEWIASNDNLAGSYRLSRGSRIVGGIQAPQATLLWTDVDCWSMQYVGPEAVYSFSVVGSGCGLISPKARAIQGRNTYWMSPRGFFVFGDSGVQPISCPVWDTIFYNLDATQTDRIFAWSNSTRHEVFFFYPSASGGTGEIDAYVKMNTIDGSWDYGALCRTSGIDESVFGLPLAADQNYRIQQHEVGFDDDGTGMVGAYVETGFVSLMEGDVVAFVDEMQPDLKWLGTGGSVNVTIFAQVTSAGEIQQFGPYSVTSTTERVPLRIRARQVALKYEWTDTAGYSARIGLPRIRITQSGRAP